MNMDPRRSKIRDWAFSAALFLLIGAITFLPLVSQLGFYVDDWQTTWAGRTQGAMRIFQMSVIDRPMMGVNHTLAYLVLGDTPIYWHLYAWLLRILGTLAFLWLARLLWPAAKQATLLMAVLFLVYPGFLSQPIANSYQDHLMAFAMGLLSLGFSVRALQVTRKRDKILFSALAIPTALYCYLVMEWMVGLEAVRGILLLYLLRRDGSLKKISQLAVAAARSWLPNLIAVGIFLFWRIVIFKDARSATDVSALGKEYLSHLLPMLLRLVMETLRSYIQTVFLAWGVPFYNLTLHASYSDLLLSIGLALVGVGVFVFFFTRVFRESSNPPTQAGVLAGHWELDAVLLGAVIALVTLLPVIAANRAVQFQDTFDRYTLAASLGVVMLVVGGAKYLLKGRQTLWLAGFLVAISIMTHYNNAAYYRDFWNYERQFWWQLAWRAPDIKKDTTLLALLPRGYHLAEAYTIWAPANMIYHPQKDALWLSGEIINEDTLSEIIHGGTYTRTFRKVNFKIDAKTSLVLSYPGAGSCLHAQDGSSLEISPAEEPIVRLMASVSRLDLIDPSAPPALPPTQVFGAEPPHAWCYYYQKAQLARQAKQWDEVMRLGDEATARGLAPQDTSEWMPFYEAYARGGRTDEMNQIGGHLRSAPGFIDVYCNYRLTQKPPADHTEENLVKNICPANFQ
jgi:hypothetical protein